MFSVTDNATGSPHLAAVVGSGTDFMLSVSPGSATVTAGQNATYTLSVTPLFGFNQSVNLSCSGLPQASTCAFTPASVTLDGTHAATVTVTVSTTKRSVLPPGGRRREGPPLVAPFVTFALALFSLLAILAGLTISRSTRRAWLLMGVLLFALFWAACDISSQTVSGTPAGSYSVGVTGTYGSTAALKHSVQAGLTVN